MNDSNNSVSCASDKNVGAFDNLKRLFFFGKFFQKYASDSQKTLAEKIAEPADILEMKRIYTDPADPLEEQTIDKFLHFYFGLPQETLPKPHTNTFAMPGRPLFAQIRLKNGMAYLAAISEVGEISWFKSIDGKVSGFNPAEHNVAEIKQMAERKEIFPAADLNRDYYKILLYPYYADGKIREDDFLDLGLKKDAPLDSKHPVQLDRIIFSSRKSSFDIFRRYLDEDKVIGLGTFFPPHLLKVFQKLEEFYEAKKTTLGKMIYTLFSSKNKGSVAPLRSVGKGIPVYNTEVVNPNLKQKLGMSPSKTPYPIIDGR